MRQGLQILAVAVILAIVGFLGYRYLFPDETYSLLVRSAERAVLQGRDGTTRILAAGDVVSEGERVRTEEGGSAFVGSGESEVQIQASTSMLVKRLDESGMDIELENGQFSAHVRNGSPAVRVSNRGRSVYATDADFAVASDTDGTLAVETTRGQLTLEGIEGATSLTSGERVMHVPGQTAVKGVIPEKLLLEVEWPESSITREAEITVHGRTDPYARVRVGRDGTWQEVRADANGAFATDIALEEGPNPLEVRAKAAMGQEERTTAELERKSTPPSGNANVDYGER